MNRFFTILLLTFSYLTGFATHNRAGEITFKHVSGLTYEVTVVTYTYDLSPADRPKLEINWGDNSGNDSIPRISKIFLGNNINKNVYVANHTFPGAGIFKITVTDPNRNAGIINIPNSVNVVFFIESWLYIDPFNGVNNSPDLLNPPIDNACVGYPYYHNPAAYDQDGDSLVFSLIPNRRENGQPILGYFYPQATNSLSINPSTGEVIWDSPTQQGEFNIAILVQEFRNGKEIGRLVRDMQITVGNCTHTPPVIQDINKLCVIAGDTLSLNILAQDNDNLQPKQTVTLTAVGGPFLQTSSPAVFNAPVPMNAVVGQFYWETNCTHVKKNPHLVYFKAVDNGSPNLVDFSTLEIQVIGPPITNLTATPLVNAMQLNWDVTTCAQSLGYKIYRKKGCSSWTPDSCTTGVPASTGYVLIGTVSGINNNSYIDNNNGLGLTPGENYSYRVTAIYPDGAESKASDEACEQLKKDVPILTNVSVNTTSSTNGSIYLAWSKPTEHDTILFPGPYRYVISRGTNSSNLNVIDSTLTINDTLYTDTLLNTLQNQYYYRVDMYDLSSGRTFMGKSSVASSVFLNLTPGDNKLTLTWNENTPWTNSQHVIYRQNAITLNFDSIGITSLNSYTDSNLTNGKTYCYKVKSIGAYTSPGLINPIINYSQESCLAPVDNEPPCTPSLSIAIDCENSTLNLTWLNPNNACTSTNDVLSYNLYKLDSLNGDFYLIATINNASDTSYTYENLYSIAGCYAVAAVDSFNNESAFDSVCVENCPSYVLPNVFTPGNDGFNDLFIPFPYKYVASIELKIYNRWGQLMFETTDPDVNWDGTNTATGKPCSDGVYFYVCTVNEIFLEGIKPRKIKGYVQLLRNK